VLDFTLRDSLGERRIRVAKTRKISGIKSAKDMIEGRRHRLSAMPLEQLGRPMPPFGELLLKPPGSVDILKKSSDASGDTD